MSKEIVYGLLGVGIGLIIGLIYFSLREEDDNSRANKRLKRQIYTKLDKIIKQIKSTV